MKRRIDDAMRCPVCRYPLLGLGPVGHCPECGFSFDDDTWLWTNPAPIRQRLRAFLTLYAILLIVTLCLVLPTMTRGGIAPFWTYMALVILGAWTWSVVRRLRQLFRGRSFVCTGPDGLVVRHGSAAPTCIPWSTVTTIKPRRWDGVCRVIAADHDVELDQEFFDGSGDVIVFIREVEQRLAGRPVIEPAEADERAANTLLETCPACRGDLRRCDMHTTCPRCGMALDRRWIIFRAPVVSYEGVGAALWALALPITVLSAIQFGTAPWKALIAGGTLIVLADRVVTWIARRPRPFVAVGPAGVVLWRRRHREQFPWEDVRYVRESPEDNTSLTLGLSDDERSIPGAYFGKDFAASEACLAAIRRTLERQHTATP